MYLKGSVILRSKTAVLKKQYFLLKWLVHPEVVTIIQIKRIRQVKHVGRLKQVDPKAEEAKNSC